MRTLTGPLVLTAALALCACATPPAIQGPGRALLLELNAADDAGRHTISGRVMAPPGVAARLISNDGAGLIGNDGAGVVAQGAGNLITNDGGSRHLKAAGDLPLAHARVWLTDAAGQPLAGLEPVTTDADGRFRASNVPMAASGLARAEAALPDGRPVFLEAPLGAPEIDLASTLAVAAMRASGEVAGGDRYVALVAAFAAAPPDGAVPALGDPAALARMAAGAAPAIAPTPAPQAAAQPDGSVAVSGHAGAEPEPEASLVCARMQPKLGAPPTTICTPWRP